jgi:cytochrome c peroxidase
LQYQYNVGVNSDIPILGRVLFYDQALSINNSISCASCHKQALAFADNNRFSRGFENRLTSRNSMPIQNLQSVSFQNDSVVVIDFLPFVSIQPLFWDGRETDLEQMVMRPIVNHVEMGITDVDKLAEKLSSIPYYTNLFESAYGAPDVTPQKIANALSWFIRSITSANTRLDKSQFSPGRGSTNQAVQLTPLEQLGQQVFNDKYECNSCHQVQNPHGYLQLDAGVFATIGLDPVYVDNGLGANTKSSNANGMFKIPSLRNIMLTAPYMHDGRFNTLEEVIDHYSEGIANHPNLDQRLKDSQGNALRLNITSNEKNAIIAFLNTLTDYEMISDPKFSNPFKAK